SAHRLPAAGRHIVSALRDCRLRAADDPVLLGCTHALAQLALEHLRADAGEPTSSSEAVWRHIRLLLQERFHEPLSRSGVARLLGLHPATVSVLCRRFGGAGFVDLLNGYRLDRGRELLRRGGLDVAGVAARVGMGSSTYFGRLFKRRFGRTPSQWRIQAGTATATGPGGRSER
ncbi:MAG: helix-turn-helix transcriptional regulator, partial [Planctomycetota bacterium]